MYKTEKIMLYFPTPIVLHISTVSDTILPDFHFQRYPSCAMLFDTVFRLNPLQHSRNFFFTYFDKFNLRYSTIQLLQHQQYVCITVYSEWTTASDYNNGNCKRQMSHPSNTDYFASIFFPTSSTDQDLHRSSTFRVYLFLPDIFSWTIYSFIHYAKF